MTAPRVELGDGLKEYMARADETSKDLLLSDHKLVKALHEYDEYFRRDLWAQAPSGPALPFILFLNAYQMFLAAARTALSGHMVAVLPLLRTALESAAYGFAIEQKPELSDVWSNRHESEKAKKACRSAFTFDKSVTGLRHMAPDIYELARRAYDSAIDYGAHPNPRGIFGHVSIEEERPDGLTAVVLTSLYGAGHVETNRGLCACLDFGLAIIGIIALSGKDVGAKRIAELQALSDAKNDATADYMSSDSRDR